VSVPGKSPVKVYKVLDIFLLGKLHIVYIDRGAVSLRVVNVTWIDLDSLAFILHLLNQFFIASRLFCSMCEAMAGSLSVATTGRIVSIGCCGRFW
jgi:hypothetical protein